MTYSLDWLVEVLMEAGLKVAPVPGWKARGRREMGTVLGVMCHHTAGPRVGNMPSLRTLVEGRSDLSGPLAQLGLGRDGTFYVIAAGRCNHAGRGQWRGLSDGNGNFIGIEAENTGKADDLPWPEVQLDAYRRGVAALLKRAGRSSDYCVGHKEYARPVGRKPDPSFDMQNFRDSVAAIMDGTIHEPKLIPAVEPATSSTGAPARATLRRGASGDLVREVQRVAGAASVDGFFGPKTEAAVRAFQRRAELVADGIVGPKTWEAIDRVA